MNENDTNLFNAIKLNKDPEEVKRLIKAGANPNAVDDDELTALMWVAWGGGGKEEKVRLPDNTRNCVGRIGWTILPADPRKEDAEIAEVLLSEKAEPNAARSDGITALMMAAYNGHAEVVKMLLSAGANVDAANDDGVTALMAAAQEGYTEVVKILIAAGANLNAADKDGWTTLMFAAQKGHTEVAEILLSVEANPNTENKYGRTALDIAEEEGHDEFIRILEEAGAE